jgi:hypothetical protein
MQLHLPWKMSNPAEFLNVGEVSSLSIYSIKPQVYSLHQRQSHSGRPGKRHLHAQDWSQPTPASRATIVLDKHAPLNIKKHSVDD